MYKNAKPFGYPKYRSMTPSSTTWPRPVNELAIKAQPKRFLIKKVQA